MSAIKKAPSGNHSRPGRPNPVGGCPLTAALAAIGGKWKLIIVYWLAVHVAGLVQVSVGKGTMRPFILVGIENTERRRDMTGPTENEQDKKVAPRVGGSAAFRAEFKPRTSERK